mmetsp:Transcript_59086/g.129591  ORF Transcript_59086/g.129591 Transcript_59086/m.129591 type:complete len:291 (+) Transcript_59086:1274-2146(+)
MLQAACDATGSNEATQVLELVAHIEGSCGEVLAWHLMWHLGGWADLGSLCPIHSIHRLLGRRVGSISPDFVQDQRKFSRKVTKFYHHFFQLLDLPRVPSDIYARLQVCTDAFHQPCIAPKSRLQGLPFHLPWWSSELPSLQKSQASADVLGINRFNVCIRNAAGHDSSCDGLFCGKDCFILGELQVSRSAANALQAAGHVVCAGLELGHAFHASNLCQGSHGRCPGSEDPPHGRLIWRIGHSKVRQQQRYLNSQLAQLFQHKSLLPHLGHLSSAILPEVQLTHDLMYKLL